MNEATRSFVGAALALAAVASLVLGPGLLGTSAFGAEPPKPPPQVQQQELQLNNGILQQVGGKGGGKLIKLPLPDPEAFETTDGRKGWRIKIPGGRPLATPAVVDGVVYVGGGFGSHEFYALDASTGARVWTCKTGDDGPTAAVVSEGCVTYNTESCTLFVHDAKTGKVLWHRWLGDPLMSQPAIGGGRLFMAYPGKDGSHHLVAFELRTGKALWDHKIAAEIITAPVVRGESVFAATTDGTLYRFDVKTGKRLWATKCNVTCAPRIVGDKVYISQRAVRKVDVKVKKGEKVEKKTADTTVEGLNVVDARTGKLAFAEPQAAIRAAYLLSHRVAGIQLNLNAVRAIYGETELRLSADATVHAIRMYPASNGGYASLRNRLSEFAKSKVVEDPHAAIKDAEEALKLAKEIEKAKLPAGKGVTAEERKRGEEALRELAEKLRTEAKTTRATALTAKDIKSKLKAIEKEVTVAAKEDASVGFPTAPQTAKLGLAAGNIGQGNVKAIWAYQGSRPNILGSQAVSVSGDRFRSVDTATGKVVWDHEVQSKVDATRPATPPALAGGKFYFGTADGRIVCADPKTGKTLWETKVGGRILFEPAVVGGKVYAATNDGTLICLDTGDASADGWPMWGGSARHNGPEAKTAK